MAATKNTFLCTVTLTCILLDGGREPNKKYNGNQLWHADVVGSAGQNVVLDNVQANEFRTSIAFWEPNVDLIPRKGCVAIVTGEAAFVSNRSGDESVTEPALKIRASQVCVLPNNVGDGSLNWPRYIQPIFNLMGYVGAGQEHASGCRSFNLTCPIWNVETKQPSEFVVRCFFENVKRWTSYYIPRPGAIVHVVGTLAGTFSTQLDGSIQPAIILTSYNKLSGVTAIDTAIGLSPATPSSKSTSKLAPPGYTKPTAGSPETPSRPRNTRAQIAVARVAGAESVEDMSRDTTSDTEGESPRTLTSRSLPENDSLAAPIIFRSRGQAAKELEDEADEFVRGGQQESRKRRRVT